VKFWDSSAIVPLLVEEESSAFLLKILEDEQQLLVWWGSPVECCSALARREREGHLTAEQATASMERLASLALGWHEVNPSSSIRTQAQRLLRVHPLRGADALQLAAAILVSEHEPASLEILTLDDRLKVAAEREGFRVIALERSK
jgi:uncharacterized protein